MKQFGLIGRSLTHSFSKNYFEKKFIELKLHDFSYDNFELGQIAHLQKLISEQKNLKGLNVTIPYKESVIPYLDELTAEAKQIGAVNCIAFKNGKTIGHNTDAYGFSQSIKPFLDRNHERALILGTGGASKAVAYVLKKMNIPFYFVCRENNAGLQNAFTYEQLNEQIMRSFKLIVNTTPLGTFPNTNQCPLLPYEFITPEHLLYDLVYNPPETTFLKKGKDNGAITVNGLSMLQLQAEKSWEIWMEKG
jgi:shikimate dehydrogenase